MRIKTVLIVAGVTAAVVQAQIFKEMQDKTSSSTGSESKEGITVSQPVSESSQVAVVTPVAVEPEPAVVVGAPMKNLPVAAPADVDTVKVSAEPSGGSVMKNGLISLNLKDAELSNVVRLFATLSDANIISPELDSVVAASKVDVNLKNVEWKPALQAILDGKDLELYEKIPGAEVYSIRKKLPAAEAIKNTRTFIFKHADIAQASAMITSIVGERGQVFAYPQGNAIVVKTTQEIMDDVIQIADRIDTPRQQALIDARIMELSDEGSNERGVDFRWDKIMNGVADPLAVNPVKGGVSSFGSKGIPTEFASPGITGIGTLTLESQDVGAVIKALQTKGNARTVSNPKVIVANGQTARINILTRVPKISQTVNKTIVNGALQTSVDIKQDEDGTDPDTKRKRYVEYEFGIRLAVTPTIYTEDNIAVEIVPIISRQNSEKTVDITMGTDDAGSALKATYYAIDEKRVNTTFMLGNKRTAVIGGLTETKNVDSVRKVPLLGDIPLIRHLFTHKYTQKVQTENIIFVTVGLEDGKSFDMDKAVKKSPLTRKQLVRDEGDQAIDDNAVEALKTSEESRIKEENKKNDRAEQATAHDHELRKPFWNFLRP